MRWLPGLCPGRVGPRWGAYSAPKPPAGQSWFTNRSCPDRRPCFHIHLTLATPLAPHLVTGLMCQWPGPIFSIAWGVAWNIYPRVTNCMGPESPDTRHWDYSFLTGYSSLSLWSTQHRGTENYDSFANNCKETSQWVIWGQIINLWNHFHTIRTCDDVLISI